MTEENKSKQYTTVLGTSFNYQVGHYTQSGGLRWIKLTQSTSDGDHSSSTLIEPEDLPAICDALEDAGGTPRQRTAQRIPAKFLKFLQNRHTGDPWDRGEEGLLVHLTLACYSTEEIAARLGRPETEITDRLQSVGFYEEMDLENC
ncbi:MAG: hypothetical protein P1U58_17570 [Verrucomicrobiales bacterium]|nr:hypothetical protein [Verrucomicrobiales bacterium]